jgi:aspartate kinase
MSLGSIVVQKYGGSSVATAEKILAIADRIKTILETTPHLVVAVSAMGKTTDQLVALARQVSSNPHGRDYDLLLASGEQVAVATLALALQGKGVPAIALTGAQCNIRTDGSWNRARIQSIDTARIEEELHKGRVVIVAGFQGVTENDEVTTLGRGGGDITGAAVAAALNASVCEICTDVDGVLSADPNVVPDAKFWPEITYEEAIEMASSGAKVLHPRAAEICHSYKIPIHVRSSFHLKEGTWIREGAKTMEEALVVGVTSDKKIAKVTLLNVPDKPGVAAQIFEDVAAKDINIRLIIQSAAAITAPASRSSSRKTSPKRRRSCWLNGRRKGSPRTAPWRRAWRRLRSSVRGWRPLRAWQAGCSAPWRARVSTWIASARRR